MIHNNDAAHRNRLEQAHLEKLQQKAEAERKRNMEDKLFDIEVRRDKRERAALVISGSALGISIAAFALALLQWILN